MDTKENVILDSGKERSFDSGSKRDAAIDKGRMDLIPAGPIRMAIKNGGFVVFDEPKKHLTEAYESAMLYLEKNKEDKNFLYSAIKNLIIAIGIDEGKNEIDNKDGRACFYYGLIQLSKHYEGGALKYGERNWELGQPTHVLFDSGCRHLAKAIADIKDEKHIRSAAWNFIGILEMLDKKPELDDLLNPPVKK